MPVRKHYCECANFEVLYDSDKEVFDKFPPIDNEGSYVPEKFNRKKLIHGLDDDSDDQEEDSDDEMAYTQKEPTPSDQAAAADPTPIQKITDLVYKDTLFYGGFCFDGVAKQFSGVSDFKVDGAGAVKIPPTDAQMDKLLSLTKPRVTFTAKFSNGLDLLKTELAKRIGYSEALFKLVFRVLLVHKTGGKEVGRHVDKELVQHQFGTLFVQPPMKHTGGQMTVYRKLSVEGDRAEEIRLNFGANNEAEASMWQFGFIAARAEHEIARITSGSRVMFVFAAAWNTKRQPQFPGPERIDRVAAQLELQCAKGEFVVAFLSETYNFKIFGQHVLNEADRSLLRQLEAANGRLEKPFKIALVSIVRHFVYKECNNSEDMEQLFSEWNFDTVDAEWEFKECQILQQWYEMDAKPWPQQPKANLELMKNVLNPMKNSLKQIWGMYAKQELKGIPSQDNESNSESEEEEEEGEKKDSDFYNYTATKTVIYKKSLLVLWPPELAIEHVAEFEGWDVAFKTLIGKSPNTAALKSLLQAYKEKKGDNDAKELIKDETIGLIYGYIDENNMLDLLPVYIDVFFPTESAFKPIFLTTNEEIWKITESTLLSDLNEHKAVHILRFLKTAQKDQAPNERRYKLLQACLCLPVMFAFSANEDILSLVLPLADKALVEILGDKFFAMKSDYYVQSFLKALLTPEFAPLREKFWTSFAPKLQQRIDELKAAVAKPFDENHPDLEAIFPKESSQAKWLMHCQAHHEADSHKIKEDDLDKAKQVEEQLKVYNLIFSAKLSTSSKGEIGVLLTKTENFKDYLTTWKNIKAEMQMLVEMEPPSMKYWKDDNLEPPMKDDDDDGDLEPPMKDDNLETPMKDDNLETPMKDDDDDGDLEPPMKVDNLDPPMKDDDCDLEDDDGDLEPPMKKQKLQ